MQRAQEQRRADKRVTLLQPFVEHSRALIALSACPFYYHVAPLIGLSRPWMIFLPAIDALTMHTSTSCLDDAHLHFLLTLLHLPLFSLSFLAEAFILLGCSFFQPTGVPFILFVLFLLIFVVVPIILLCCPLHQPTGVPFILFVSYVSTWLFASISYILWT